MNNKKKRELQNSHWPLPIFAYHLVKFSATIIISTPVSGLRQGYIQSKMALIKILNKYELILDDRTSVPMKVKASSMAYTADGGVWLKLKELSREWVKTNIEHHRWNDANTIAWHL